ncbi:class I SAM-dependent methyltransferase [Metabacillus sp. RGM 3146]|uniref:class I SAM-dependent methyltransferase n=1 Tax=Metabacillus sp. RGM 3146 TaxID=3401092 RepID=UPI003B9D2DFA
MTKSTEQTFDALAKTYEKDVDQMSPYNADYERPAMMELIPDVLEGKTILDAGCSAGWYTEALTKRGASVTGIDLSPQMIQKAEKRLNGRARLLSHDLSEPLPFQDNEFDLIVSSLTLHYLEDWQPIFEEFNRVLKQGGTLLFSTHHPFMDFVNFKCDNYFEKKQLTDSWDKPNINIDVQFYRRPMQEIINETSCFFTIEQMIEPQPKDSMRNKKPDGYQYLMTHPHFLILKAKKG